MDIEKLLDDKDNRSAWRELSKRLEAGAGVVPFVGAGMSAAFGLPGWRDFLLGSCLGGSVEALIRRQLDHGEYEEAAETLYEFLEQKQFDVLLRTNFGDDAVAHVSVQDLEHSALARLPEIAAGPVITTNFDQLIERLFEGMDIPLTIRWGTARLDTALGALQGQEPFLLKLHGDVNDPAQRVLTLPEYREAYGGTEPGDLQMDLPLPSFLRLILASRVLLFVGCGLGPDRTVSAMKSVAGEFRSLTHFAIVERPEKEAFEERRRSLSALNILPLWYPHGKHHLIGPLLSTLAGKIEDAGAPTVGGRHRKVLHNLTGKITKSFVGRRRELRDVQDLLQSRRLVSIVGPGGCGKSELALRVGDGMVGRFRDGLRLVELAAVKDADYVPQAIATELDIQEQAESPPTDWLADHLRKKQLLLLLDNCEHQLRACRRIIRELLAECPDLKVLATSRQKLGLQAERVFRLKPMPFPQEDDTASPQEVESYDAVRLFVDRAQRRFAESGHDEEFRINAENAQAVSEICRRLDGLPLAIELVASRLATRSAQRVAQELAHDRVFRLALNRYSDADDRHKNLAAAIDWSYNLLSGDDQRLLRGLSVFRGGWTLESMTAICASPNDDPFELSDQLEKLVDFSLVVPQSLGQRRFRFLETIRQFGRERLREEADWQAVRRSHAQWFIQFAERAKPKVLGEDQKRWLKRLEVERDNLRAAMAWTLEEGEFEDALRLRCALWRFWEIRGYYREGLRHLTEILDKARPELNPAAYAEVLSGAGLISFRQGKSAEAAQLFSRAYELQQTLNDDQRLADCLNDVGLGRQISGRLEESLDYYKQSLELQISSGSRRGQGVARFNVGAVLVLMDRLDEGEPYLHEGLKIFKDEGNIRDGGFPNLRLGFISVRRREWAQARRLTEESLAEFEQASDQRGMGECLCTLAWTDLHQGRLQSAEKSLARAFALHRSIRNRRGLARCLELLALVRFRKDEPGCLFFLAASDAIRERMEVARPPIYQADIEAMHAQVERKFPPQAWEEARQTASDLSNEELLQRWPLGRAEGQPGSAGHDDGDNEDNGDAISSQV